MSIFSNIKKGVENFQNLFESLPNHIKEHSIRVSKVSKFLYEKCLEDGIYPDDFDLDEAYLDIIEEASKYHDIGKAMLDEQVLLSSTLTPEGYKYIQSHTTNILDIIDEDFLSLCDNPQLYSLMSDIALFHHEQWDGRGYPHEYFEENVPIAARIVAIANKLDHLLYPQPNDNMAKLEFPYAIKEVQNLSLSYFDPLLVSLLVKYQYQIERIIDEVVQELKIPKKKKQIPKEKTQKDLLNKKIKLAEELPPFTPIKREGPAITINLLPAYDVIEKEAKIISFDLVLNDTKLGKIRHKDYFYVAQKSNRLLSLIDINLKRMNEYVLALEKKKLDCILDVYVSANYLKTPNYFQSLLKILENYPKVIPKLCFTFDGYDFIDGDVDFQKIKYLKDMGIKIAFDNKESLYRVPELLSLYEIDFIKMPFKLVKGISSHSKIAFLNTMKTIYEYKVIPIIYDVDNYIQFKKCRELELQYLQGEYLGNVETNKIDNFIHPQSAVWIKNE